MPALDHSTGLHSHFVLSITEFRGLMFYMSRAAADYISLPPCTIPAFATPGFSDTDTIHTWAGTGLLWGGLSCKMFSRFSRSLFLTH